MTNIFGYEDAEKFVDLQGNPVKRDKYSYPYSYDPHVEWKGDFHEESGIEVYSDRNHARM